LWSMTFAAFAGFGAGFGANPHPSPRQCLSPRQESNPRHLHYK
jgi:hypothetical protein